MPCRNDWDPPTKAQAENRRAAKMLIALNNIQGKTSSTQLLVDSTNPVLDTDYVGVLCERMKALSDSDREAVLYGDAHDPRARDLATWWEEHQARDEVRMRTAPTLVGVDTASGPDMTAVSIVPRLQLGQQEYLVPVPREQANMGPGRHWWPVSKGHADNVCAAAPQQAEPVEIVPRVWRETLRKLTFMARTSGGTPGPDEGLQTACAEAETLLSKPYNYPPAAPQQAEPVAWMAFGGALVHAVTRNAMDPIEAERFDVPLYLHPPAAPQQAEPVEQIGWSDEFGNLFPMGAWKPAQRTHHDSHKAAWRPVFLHPPAAEVQRLREALEYLIEKCGDSDDAQYSTLGTKFVRDIARRALEGK